MDSFATMLTPTPHFFLALAIGAFAQNTNAQWTPQKETRIDSLFTGWTAEGHPGGVVSVAQNGQVVYQKAFGQASLRYSVANTPSTAFNIASISKQFTAMGIVLLEQEGKLSFDDDIHKHLPELPDFGQPITIRHLLHHMSGLRSLHAMLGLAGWRGGDPRTNGDHWRYVLKQRDLNFVPGDLHRYSNTGYILLANIVERISGESFKDWMRVHVFDPLDMPHTYVEDNFDAIGPGNATSYRKTKDGFEKEVEVYGYYGSGNMHSTAGDLHRWLQNFHHPKAGWEVAFQQLLTKGVLNNDDTITYGFGIYLDHHLGRDRIQHGGAIAGFRDFVSTYPAEALDIVVLTNFTGGAPDRNSEHIAEIILGHRPAGDALPPIVEVPESRLKQLEGFYWNDLEGYKREIRVVNDTLRYARVNRSYTLLPTSDLHFVALPIERALEVVFTQPGEMTTYRHGQKIGTLSRYEPTKPDRKLMEQYTGSYYSDELETLYQLYVNDKELIVYHNRHGEMKTTWIMDDVVVCPWPVGTVRIKRDEAGAVTGLTMSNTRAFNVAFRRVDIKSTP